MLIHDLSEQVIIGAATVQKWRMKLNLEIDKVIIDRRSSDKLAPYANYMLGRYLSGQRGQTVNLLAMPSQVRILLSPLQENN